jgi:hypothetical protein
MSAGAAAQVGLPLNHNEDPKLEPATVREVVARYCRMDYAGARLNAADWPKIQPTVAWKTNPEYPLFMVISRFDVSPELLPGHGKYEITVTYRLLGRFDLTEGYSQEPGNGVEEARFTVTDVNGDWLITDIQPNFPHVSKAVAAQWTSRKLAAAADPVGQTIYQNALQLLQGQNSSPMAK